MFTIILLLLLSAVFPWSWTRGLVRILFGWAWPRSTLKMGVEIYGRKVSSFKDKELTKKYQEDTKK